MSLRSSLVMKNTSTTSVQSDDNNEEIREHKSSQHNKGYYERRTWET